MNLFTTTALMGGVKRPYDEDESITESLKKKSRGNLAPLELLLSDVFIHIFKDFGFKDLLNVERISRSFCDKTEESWKLMAQKNSCFDLESYPKESCPERWQCLVREVLLLQVKSKASRHAAILQLFPRLNFIGDQKSRPVFVRDSARGGDFLLEGLYQLTRPLYSSAFIFLNEAFRRNVSHVSYFALRSKGNIPPLTLYPLVKAECEKGDFKGMEYLFRNGMHWGFREWKTDGHLPFIGAQVLFQSPFSWEEKEKRLDNVLQAYDHNPPSWIKARCAYVKFKLGKQAEADRLYKEALDDFKLSIPERKWSRASKLIKALYLEIYFHHEDRAEAHKFYEMAAQSYPSEDTVWALMWAGIADLYTLFRDFERADVFFEKAILASNAKLPDRVWEAAVTNKFIVHDWEGLSEICQKALDDLAAGDSAKAPTWLRTCLNGIEASKKQVEDFF